MAYEISEGAAAAALFIPENELNETLTSANIEAALKKIYNIISDNQKIHMSKAERTEYMTWFNPSKLDETYNRVTKTGKLTAIVHGYSAAIGIKKWMKSTHGEYNSTIDSGNVFITGASFHQRIKFLQVTVGDWSDYNSSDIVVIKGNCYYGISLKKKNKLRSSNPPMINKSVVNLLTELGKKEMSDTFVDSRINYFGGLIRDVMRSGGPLEGSKLSINLSNEDLLNKSIWNPYKNEWTALINIKGTGKIDLTGPKELRFYKSTDSFLLDDNFQYVQAENVEEWKKNPFVANFFGTLNKKWEMRNFVNKSLGTGQSSNGHIYKQISDLANDGNLPKQIGEKLIQSVLKTELKQSIQEAFEGDKAKHFGFALVTALGKVTSDKTGETYNITQDSANVKDNPLIQEVLKKMKESENWFIRINNDLTEKKRKQKGGPPGKIFFQVGIEKSNKFWSVLDMEVRYKGSFTASPQFIGGMSKSFEKELSKTKLDKDFVYNFGKACETT
jgi:hypothetical protein